MELLKSSQLHATFIGATAILLWSTLATITKFIDSIPPFQLICMSFSIAFLIGYANLIRNKRSLIQNFIHPPKVWINGIFGLFGYHLFYFIALKNAPAAEASLIAYLWPLLIVLLATLLLNESFRWYHLLGASLGLTGAILIIGKDFGNNIETQYLVGYIAALICAFIWSIYSVLSRKFGEIPTDSVGSFCGVTAILALVCHMIIEETIFPNFQEITAILLLGLGPVGIAFFTWDHGMKKGNIQTLGALSYTAPLFSVLILISFNFAEFSWTLGLACFLIIMGAMLAAGDFLKLK